MRSLFPLIIEHGHPTLEALEDLRLKGKNDDTMKTQLDRVFDRRRKNIDKCISKENNGWFHVSSRGMKTLVTNTNVLPLDKLTRFLDLGCCPGGYSNYFLQGRYRVRGVGVSLEEQNGGYPLRIKGDALARYDMHRGDFSFYDICWPSSRSRPHPGDDRPLSQIPFAPSGFQLIDLDAHRRPLRGSEATSGGVNDRLLIAQLILGLQCVDPGGSLIVTLKQVDCVRTAQVLYMLDKLSRTTVTFKNPDHQKTSCVFHAVTTGIGLGDDGARLPAYLEHLKEVWWEMTYGGEEGKGRNLLESDLDFIVDYATLAGTYLNRLMEFGENPWSVQKNALTEISRKLGQTSWRRDPTDTPKSRQVAQSM